MKFFEEGEFFDFEEEEEAEAETFTCTECKATFLLPDGEIPDQCPACGIKFLSEFVDEV